MTSVDAKPIFDSAESVVEAGRAVAVEVNRTLDHDREVFVSLKGVLAASSSFFNILFVDVLAAHGKDAVCSRLRLIYNSKVQESIAKRSLDAVLASQSV